MLIVLFIYECVCSFKILKIGSSCVILYFFILKYKKKDFYVLFYIFEYVYHFEILKKMFMCYFEYVYHFKYKILLSASVLKIGTDADSAIYLKLCYFIFLYKKNMFMCYFIFLYFKI